MDVVKQKDSNISVLSLWHTHDSQDEFLSANSSFVIFHQSNVLLAVLKQLQLFDPPTFMRKKITSLDPPTRPALKWLPAAATMAKRLVGVSKGPRVGRPIRITMRNLCSNWVFTFRAPSKPCFFSHARCCFNFSTFFVSVLDSVPLINHGGTMGKQPSIGFVWVWD